MKRFIFTLFLSIGFACAICIPAFVLNASAADDSTLSVLRRAGAAAGTSAKSPGLIVGEIIQFILGFLGLIFLILMIYAGFLWMTAEGEETKVAKARGMIFHAVIGLVIVLSSFAIATFVVNRLREVAAVG